MTTAHLDELFHDTACARCRHAVELGGLVAAAWVKVEGSAIAAQVTVKAAHPGASPEWFGAPVLIPPLSRAAP